MDLLKLQFAPPEISKRTDAIRLALFRDSPYVRTGQFTAIAPGDIAHLFRFYDQSFFEGWLSRFAVEQTGKPIDFRLSSTMTRAGGKTTVTRKREAHRLTPLKYEIAIASRMLFMNFKPDQRPVSVVGHECADRMSALQRIMEHEIIHLAELLNWGSSACSKSRFATLARRIFDHRATKHDLITPREMARETHGLRVGQRVRFTINRQALSGIINRLNFRATVLVEDSLGQRYSNGKKYVKYYVPMNLLEPD